MTWPCRHLSVAIRRTPEDVYAFAADARNLPRWAAGFARAVRRDGDAWVAESPVGEVRVRFVAKNALRVLDHDVTLPSGDIVHNPMRVLRNDAGSEAVFTLYRRDGVGETEYEEDARSVAADLRRLKAILEEEG